MTDAELVKEAAEKVMGWKEAHASRDVDGHYAIYSDGKLCKRERETSMPIEWNPLANDSDAMMLVDKLATGGREFTLEYAAMIEFKGQGWYANFDDTGIARDPNRRRAIVLAALRAEAGGKG